MAGHAIFGPYVGCRYVGRGEGHGDVEVWLLYSGVPHGTHGGELRGVLYNRITARNTDRTDRWLARAYGPRHHHEAERLFKGRTQDEAAWNLWDFLNPNASTADRTQAEKDAGMVEPDAGCEDSP